MCVCENLKRTTIEGTNRANISKIVGVSDHARGNMILSFFHQIHLFVNYVISVLFLGITELTNFSMLMCKNQKIKK